MSKWFIVGGAGFIGSHFTNFLLNNPNTEKLTIYDNLSSGRSWHYQQHLNNPKFQIINKDIKDLPSLTTAIANHNIVLHLASNPDISKATIQPDIDFWEGTYLTSNVLEAMRLSGVKRILYASGSGVYGNLQHIEAYENYGPLQPVSTYGASKLAGEALINSYCHMFDMTACIFRFGNVVGARQTHGVVYDFIKQLLSNAGHLNILGDGTQSKSYINISDVISAVLLANAKSNSICNTFNVATGDYITVNEIADLVINNFKFSVNKSFTGGNKGWKGDVPIIRLNTDRIKSLGWICQKNCKEALQDSIDNMLPDFLLNRI